MKEKKPVPILLPILYWTCAVIWSINVGLHFYHDTFDFASFRVMLDIACALLWIAAAIIQTIRYKNQNK